MEKIEARGGREKRRGAWREIEFHDAQQQQRTHFKLNWKKGQTGKEKAKREEKNITSG